MCTVGVDAAHTGKARVQRNQHVETLGLPNLSDNQPVRPHPEGFLDEAPQRYFAVPFEIRLPALQAHDVAQGELELENFLYGHHPLTRADAGAEAIEHCCLACLGSSGNENIQSARHRRAEETCSLR
jgi:hypothetical protein